RDESATIGKTVASLLSQDYPGDLRVIVVDDQSRDDTAAQAKTAAQQTCAADRIVIVNGRPLPPGWAGKVWAMKQGVESASSSSDPADYILFTDADIE